MLVYCRIITFLYLRKKNTITLNIYIVKICLNLLKTKIFEKTKNESVFKMCNFEFLKYCVLIKILI